MAESSSHNPPSLEITPKEEHVTFNKPESPNPFLPADQTLDNSKIWVSTPTGGIRGDIGITTFRNALKAHYLPHSNYSKLIWEDIIHKLNKKTKEKVFNVLNWALKLNQHEGPPFTDHMKAICNIDVLVDSQAPKTSSQAEKVPQGKKPGAKIGLRRKKYSKHTSESQKEASKSKIGQSDKDTQSSSAKDKSPSHHLPPTPVVGEMHKEAQQAAGGPTSLGATSEDGAHPQLSSDQTKSVRDGLKTAQTDSGTNEESRADEISKKIKLEDLSDLLIDIRYAFFTPDSPQDESIIVSDESEEEEEVAKDKDTHASSYDVPEDTSTPYPPSPKLAHIQELMV
ncbi:hypothetical protein Tco_1366844 [Tanacetum coccineum]